VLKGRMQISKNYTVSGKNTDPQNIVQQCTRHGVPRVFAKTFFCMQDCQYLEFFA